MAEILGQKTRLRPLEERDLDARARWFADPDIAELMGQPHAPEGPTTPEQWRTFSGLWFNRRMESRGVYLFAIEDDSGALIGDIDLQDLGGSCGAAWLTIEIGDKDYWGQGYGTDALNALLRYAFRSLGILQIRLNVKRANVRAIRCYEKCGFVKEAEEEDEFLMVAMAESCEI